MNFIQSHSLEEDQGMYLYLCGISWKFEFRISQAQVKF